MTVTDGLMEGGGKTCLTGSRRQEAESGGWGGDWTRTPHPSHEQGTLVLCHCDTDNTVFTPGLQPRGIGDFIIQTAEGWGWGVGCSGLVCVLSTVSDRSVAKGSISIVRPN